MRSVLLGSIGFASNATISSLPVELVSEWVKIILQVVIAAATVYSILRKVRPRKVTEKE